MPLAAVTDLVKTFRVAERGRGIAGALGGLLRRRHRVVRALDGITFAIEPGELVGYIGPNGAGKSTTVKILSGILVPDTGDCRVLGRVPWKERVEHVRHIAGVGPQPTSDPIQPALTLLAEEAGPPPRGPIAGIPYARSRGGAAEAREGP